MLNWKQFAQPRYLFLLPLLLGLILSLYIKNNLDGLPIDDAYIYMQYVENISNGNGYSFNPGEVSFGATSFLFTVMVSMVNIFLPGMTPLTALQWTGIFWFLVCIVMVQVILWRQTQNLWLSLAGGFLIAGCRVLLFTAPAGLEASMFCALCLMLLYTLIYTKPNPIWLGILGGIIFLTRPEGILILAGFMGYYLLSFYIHPVPFKQMRDHIIQLGWIIVGLLVAIFPYMVFVKLNSGYWLPTTYYGKLLHHNIFVNFSVGEKIRNGFNAITLSVIQIIEQDPTAVFYCVLYGLTGLLAVVFIYQCGKKFPPRPHFASFAIFLSLIFLLPFLYGYKFKLYHQFGGYFIRYIQIILILIHIAGLLGLHEIIKSLVKHIPKQQNQLRVYSVSSALVAVIVVLYALPFFTQLHLPIPAFVQLHAQVNEGVRKQTGYWIKENTPLDAKVLVGTTGLGVVGAYCERQAFDEAGLINPDIHPYLYAYSATPGDYQTKLEAHFYSIMNYMALNNIQYYTAFGQFLKYGALPVETRFTQHIATITDPALRNTELSDHAEIHIYKFTPQKHYHLWSDYEPHLSFEDQAENPINDNRVKLTFWDQIPVIAIDTRMVKAEIRGEYVFPENAVFTAGLALDFPERDYSGEWIEFEVEVETFHERKSLFKERIPIDDFTPRKPLKTIEVDLSQYSHQFGELIISLTSAEKKEPSVLWAGWVNPELKSKAAN